ncbi:MAG: DEAD/DEAH box helicase [Nitrospiraceae bacterium]
MKLYDFQRTGVEFLKAAPRRYLADTMGLGKTPQACVAAAELGSRNTLVVAPASALENWRREWDDWGPAEIPTVMSFDILRRYGPTSGAYDLTIIDEAHYCKTPSAKRTKAAMLVARQSPRSWLLSGTPMPNHPGELYAPIAALWPEELERRGIKTYAQWFNRYCRWYATQYGPKVYGVKNAHEIREWQARAMLRRRVEDVALDLPPLRVHLHRLSIPDTIVQGITGEETARQRRLLGSFKAPLIAKLIDGELADGAYKKIVLGAYHKDTLARFHKDLAKHHPTGFDGSTPVKDRQRILDAWTENEQSRILIVQQTTAGVALNMQAAPEIVLAEPDWVPDVNAQFIKRIHRIGQDKPCRARLFSVPGTLDDSIMSGLAKKIAIQVELGLK